MARPKIKKISEKSAFFSRIFSIFFQFLINFNAYFWKITPNFRALPNSKISFHPRKIGPPPNILRTPLNRKILHKLLIKIYKSIHIADCSSICLYVFFWKPKMLKSYLSFLNFFTKPVKPKLIWNRIFGRNYDNGFIHYFNLWMCLLQK